MNDKENKLILYKDDEGRVSVNVRFDEEDVWLTQAQLVDIYQTSKSNVSEHIKHIFEDGELDENSVVRKIRITALDGKQYDTKHYNLDVIIALGYRVTSPVAVRFRRWATQRLHEYIPEGNVLSLMRKPYRKLSVSFKYIASVRCECWKATSTKLLNN